MAAKDTGKIAKMMAKKYQMMPNRGDFLQNGSPIDRVGQAT